MIVAATMHVYKEAMTNLLPTPAKSHYVFNLRDFARVVLGCLLIKPPALSSKKQFVRLWVHEVSGKMSRQHATCMSHVRMQVYRVYYDRLVDTTDRQWLFELLQKTVKQHFKEDFQGLFKHLASTGANVVHDNMRSLMFGDYMKPDAVSPHVVIPALV